MPTYVSLLRGINISGQKKITMDRLRDLYADLGFGEVTTYVQSGNVVFDAPRAGAASLSESITRQIETAFGFIVAVLIRTPRELDQIVKKNCFAKRRGVDPTKLHVTFLAQTPARSKLAALDLPRSGADECLVDGKQIYLHCPGGYGRTKLSNNLFEKKLAVTATTRNWKTVLALLELATVTDATRGTRRSTR